MQCRFQKRRLITDSINSIAWDAPFLIAFILLLSAKDATRLIPVSRAALNRKRVANGRAPLLDHIEVNASLDAVSTADSAGDLSGRQSPRLHHVRGHFRFAASIGFSGVYPTCAAARPKARFARGLSAWHLPARVITNSASEDSSGLYAHAILGESHGTCVA